MPTIAKHWEALDANGRVVLTADTCGELMQIAKRRKITYVAVDYVPTLGAVRVGAYRKS